MKCCSIYPSTPFLYVCVYGCEIYISLFYNNIISSFILVLSHYISVGTSYFLFITSRLRPPPNSYHRVTILLVKIWHAWDIRFQFEIWRGAGNPPKVNDPVAERNRSNAERNRHPRRSLTRLSLIHDYNTNYALHGIPSSSLSLFLYLSKALDDVPRSAKLARHTSVKFKYAKRKSNVASYRKIINQRYQELFLLGRMKRSQVFTRQSNLFDKWTNIYYSTSRVCRYCNYSNQCP